MPVCWCLVCHARISHKIAQGCSQREGKSVLLCSLCSSALSSLGSQSDPAVPQVPCTASAHLMLGHLLSSRADVRGCTWMQDSNTLLAVWISCLSCGRASLALSLIFLSSQTRTALDLECVLKFIHLSDFHLQR